MAEAFLKSLAGDRFEVESAGLKSAPLNPLAVKVMEEMHIDISKNHTKEVSKMIQKGKTYDYIITLCDEACKVKDPALPKAKERIFWSFDDLTPGENSEKDLEHARAVRDQVKYRVERWIKEVLK